MTDYQIHCVWEKEHFPRRVDVIRLSLQFNTQQGKGTSLKTESFNTNDWTMLLNSWKRKETSRLLWEDPSEFRLNFEKGDWHVVFRTSDFAGRSNCHLVYLRGEKKGDSHYFHLKIVPVKGNYGIYQSRFSVPTFIFQQFGLLLEICPNFDSNTAKAEKNARFWSFRPKTIKQMTQSNKALYWML